MSTTIMPDLEQETFEALDWEPTCTGIICVADRPPATHHYVCRNACGCYGDYLICDPCAVLIKEFMVTGEGDWICLRCKTKWHGDYNDSVIKFVRIK